MQRLVLTETTTFDPDTLVRLSRDMGEPGAERMIGRTMDDLAGLLDTARRARVSGRAPVFGQALRRIADRARAIGLAQIARVAGDAARTAACADSAGAAATFARLERLFDGAVHAIGDSWSVSS